MSKFEVKQKNVKDLLDNKEADFLIPDYQRPYAWGEDECDTLWNDLFAFAFPDNDKNNFDRTRDEYFLGPIVTFPNKNKKHEVIDGQQRLTTLMLLLRAFYTRFGSMKDEEAIETHRSIERCLWKTNEFNKPDIESYKLETEVATDEAKDDFKEILRTGEISKDKKSRYADNYRFFQVKIDDLQKEFSSYFALFPMRILNNCIILQIGAERQDSALQIFSTLNDRGKPLSDSDIFKAQLYKNYSKTDRKKEFIDKWKELEEICVQIYQPKKGMTYMDEAFTRYMYYERAKQGNKSTTMEALRKFYEKNFYALLKKDNVFENIIDLSNFWKSIYIQDKERFSNRILKRLFVLNYAPNGIWTYITSVYYLANRNNNGMLDDKNFYDFLNKITGIIWAYSFLNSTPNVPIYAEMVKIVNGQKVNFSEYKFDIEQITNAINNFEFKNSRPITKSMLAWWAFNNSSQNLLDTHKAFQIEHIYAKKRFINKKTFSDPRNLESIGNKSLLEDNINIGSSSYDFEEKIRYL